MKILAHLSAAIAAQAGGFCLTLLAIVAGQFPLGNPSLFDLESVLILGAISLVGLVVIGLPAIFFLCLTNQNTRPLLVSFIGILGGLGYLAVALLQEEPYSFPGWGLTLLVALHGGVTGLCYALLSRQIENKYGQPWSRFHEDA